MGCIGDRYVYVEYTTPSRDANYYIEIIPEADGKLRGQFPITSGDEIGVWKPDYIAVVDNAGNYTEVYNYQFYPSGNTKDLSAGNFEVANRNLSQAAPTGLDAVRTTTAGGTDGKITGTTNSMEYRPSTSSTYKPVTGTEITGLSAGTYYVRYAAKPGYDAGSVATVVVWGPEYVISNGVLTQYNGYGGDLVIPDNLGITSIGIRAFAYSSTLTSVTIPDSVTEIGNYAFRDCTALASIDLPSGLTEYRGLCVFWLHQLNEHSSARRIDSFRQQCFPRLQQIGKRNAAKRVS